MHASLVRRQLSGLVPPKIASPSILSAGKGADLSPLVAFYSKLPKGPAPEAAARGIKGRFFQRQERLGVAHRCHRDGHLRTWVHH
ncbi:hypothetical protein EDB83DRAFT_1800109 [Lactarius deliciosus]|nr:hypothetical protein EDB83DRAFT_1800109 [Lactarius deliciosus]